MMSSTTTSKSPVAAAAKPFTPSCSTSTTNPSAARPRRTVSASLGSSSTSRTRTTHLHLRLIYPLTPVEQNPVWASMAPQRLHSHRTPGCSHVRRQRRHPRQDLGRDRRPGYRVDVYDRAHRRCLLPRCPAAV